MDSGEIRYMSTCVALLPTAEKGLSSNNMMITGLLHLRTRPNRFVARCDARTKVY